MQKQENMVVLSNHEDNFHYKAYFKNSNGNFTFIKDIDFLTARLKDKFIDNLLSNEPLILSEDEITEEFYSDLKESLEFFEIEYQLEDNQTFLITEEALRKLIDKLYWREVDNFEERLKRIPSYDEAQRLFVEALLKAHLEKQP